jgi:hypothetical protein
MAAKVVTDVYAEEVLEEDAAVALPEPANESVERAEILKAMMQDAGEETGAETGETLVGGGQASTAQAAIAMAEQLVAQRMFGRPVSTDAGGGGGGGGGAEAGRQVHKFWDTQPVKKMDDHEIIIQNGPIDELKTPAQVKQEPYQLPRGFVWADMDVSDPEQIDEIYKLLTENYVQDDDAMFRFDYSIPFLQWALTPPGYFREWHVGVRQSNNGRLRGFISGIPAEVKVYDDLVKMSEINFLCVHQKLRAKRLAPVLIKEVTRRVNLRDQWQAVYTAGVVLPKPVGQCCYWHRSINPKKLVEIGFSRLGA